MVKKNKLAGSIDTLIETAFLETVERGTDIYTEININLEQLIANLGLLSLNMPELTNKDGSKFIITPQENLYDMPPDDIGKVLENTAILGEYMISQQSYHEIRANTWKAALDFIYSRLYLAYGKYPEEEKKHRAKADTRYQKIHAEFIMEKNLVLLYESAAKRLHKIYTAASRIVEVRKEEQNNTTTMVNRAVYKQRGKRQK